MSKINRRHFLNQSAQKITALSAGATILTSAQKAVSASEKIVIGCIGTGGRGKALTRGFANFPEVEIAYLCDVDSEREGVSELATKLENNQGRRPKFVQDMRYILDDPAVDVVLIATNDHWHGLAEVWACQAGKDVYVEKPISHNIWEGRKMVEAARKYKRVVQCGTQNRSAPYNQKAKDYIESGKLGTIHLCKVYNLKGGKPFHIGPDQPTPANLDWDLWLGPAPKRPFNPDVRDGWKLFWDYTAGDLADDGAHQLDLARWLIGKDLPTRVHSTGGTYPFNDDRQVPATLVTTYDYGDLVMTFELTQYANYMSKTDDDIRNGDLFPYWPQNATRIELYGTEGMMIVGRHGGGWQVFTGRGKVVAQEYGRVPDHLHKQNFLDCIRSRKQPNADIAIGHYSACLIHLASIALRVGEGSTLDFDPEKERFNDRRANQLLKRKYRKPYVIPERV